MKHDKPYNDPTTRFPKKSHPWRRVAAVPSPQRKTQPRKLPA